MQLPYWNLHMQYGIHIQPHYKKQPMIWQGGSCNFQELKRRKKIERKKIWLQYVLKIQKESEPNLKTQIFKKEHVG